jgi:hypothetical protein
MINFLPPSSKKKTRAAWWFRSEHIGKFQSSELFPWKTTAFYAVVTAAHLTASPNTRKAHVSEGYSSGSIVNSVRSTLTERRVERLDKRHLTEMEFVNALSRCELSVNNDKDKMDTFSGSWILRILTVLICWD